MATPQHSARHTRRATGRRATAVLASSAALLLSAAGLANADTVANSLDMTVDAVAENMPLNVGGTVGSTTITVSPTDNNTDTVNGCNLNHGSLVVSVSSSNSSAATVSPSQLTFTSCNDSQLIKVIPVGDGDSTVSLDLISSDGTRGVFDLRPATFNVHVSAAAPSNTAPTIAVMGVEEGGSYLKGSVPAAMCDVTDKEDGNSSFDATLSDVTGPYAADGIGSQTASCSYTDDGGLMASSSVTYSIVDPSAPIIGYTLDPTHPDGSNGWYRGNVTLHWTVTENESPSSLMKTGCVDQSITADQPETTYSCSATSAGGSAEQVDVPIKRDGSAPTVTDEGIASGTAGLNGWYTSPVTEAFSASDNGPSGLVDCAPSFSKTSGATQEGSAVTVASGTCSDNAGNIGASVNSPAYKVDLTDPTNVQFIGGPAAGDSYYYGAVPDAPTCTADDAVSLFDHCNVSGYSAGVGSHTMTATAYDHAGRSATANTQYSVLAWTLKGFYAPVDMNGIYNTVKGGSTVPLKFELFAGSTELTDVADVKSFTTTKIVCGGDAITDAVEMISTGGTSLRYDTAGGQFIQNWKTPTGAGTCYKATMTAQDGSTISALFKLK